MSDEEKIELKKSLKDKAIEILQERIDTSFDAMREAQLSANDEGKSSVGDKYETSRAMAHIDRDIHARQLESAQKDLSFIQQIDVTLFSKKVDIGAFVVSDSGKYIFLSGLGPIDFKGEKIIFLSINSPIGKIFLNKIKGDSVKFNNKEIVIRELF